MGRLLDPSRAAAVVIAVASVLLTPRPALASPATQLEEARRAFRTKDCESAMKTLTFLLYPTEQLADPADLAEARSMLGACKCDTGSETEAKEQFAKVLDLQPDRSLNDLLFSACAVHAFDETKKEREAAARKLADQREAERRLKAIEDYKNSLMVYEERPYFTNFVPFGAGQFVQHRRLRGALFAASEAVTGGVSVGLWLYLVSKYGINSHSVPLTDGPSVRTMQQVEIGSGLVFLGLYALGVFDSLYHYEARVRVKADDSLLKDFDKKTQKQASLRDRVHIGPIFTPGGAGIGLSLETY